MGSVQLNLSFLVKGSIHIHIGQIWPHLSPDNTVVRPFDEYIVFLPSGEWEILGLIARNGWIQNEDESHAILLHLLDHETEVLKAGAQGEVQLPVHVIYVHMLNVL